jgi:uncharacterized protein (DUF983 family)
MQDNFKRSVRQAMWRGFRKTCPNCGTGRMFATYVQTAPHCAECGLELHHHRAHDVPPYFTIMAVGHIVVPALLAVEKIWSPPLWLQFSFWLPFTLALTLWFLPRIKGATIGLQWALRMHGFGSSPDLSPNPSSPQP